MKAVAHSLTTDWGYVLLSTLSHSSHPAMFVDIAVSDYVSKVLSAYQQLDIDDAVH